MPLMVNHMLLPVEINYASIVCEWLVRCDGVTRRDTEDTLCRAEMLTAKKNPIGKMRHSNTIMKSDAMVMLNSI